MIAVLGATGTPATPSPPRFWTAAAPSSPPPVGDKLGSLTARGADPVATDLTDAGAPSAALRGADAVYTMQPVHPTATTTVPTSHPIGRRPPRGSAPRASRAPRAQQPRRHRRPGAVHRRAARAAAPPGALEEARVTALRPDFSSSFIPGIDAARQPIALADGVSPDVALPMVAARAIAHVAVAKNLRPEPEPVSPPASAQACATSPTPTSRAAFGLLATPYGPTTRWRRRSSAPAFRRMSPATTSSTARAFNQGRVIPTLRATSTTPGR